MGANILHRIMEHINQDEQFASWLSEAIERRGLSARQVAIKADYTPAFLSRLINGKVGYNRDTIERIAKALAGDTDGATVTAMVNAGLRAAGFLPPPEVGEQTRIIPEEETDVIDAYLNLPPDRRKGWRAGILAEAQAGHQYRTDIIGKRADSENQVVPEEGEVERIPAED